MRLSHFFVVVAAAFLATGALADNNNVASINEPSHRNLRKHHKIEEERGINNIPLERLQEESQQRAWSAGLSALMKRYKEVKYGRIKPFGS